MATTTTRFSEAVRAKLTQNTIAGVKPGTIGELARVMGRGNQARARTYRRSLFKWLSSTGPRPSTVSRVLVADALGIEASELSEPDDDDEADLLALASIRDMTIGDVLMALAALAGLKSNGQVAHLRGERDLTATTTEVTDDCGADARR